MNKEEVLVYYFSNEARQLNKTVERVFSHIHCKEEDKDNLLDLANLIFCQAMDNYDGTYEGDHFEKFLFCCLENKFKTELTKTNAEKRKAFKTSMSLEAIVEGAGDLGSDFDVETKVQCDRVKIFLDSLSKTGRTIVILRDEGYSDLEIQHKLRITPHRFADEFKKIKQNRNWNLFNI